MAHGFPVFSLGFCAKDIERWRRGQRFVAESEQSWLMPVSQNVCQFPKGSDLGHIEAITLFCGFNGVRNQSACP